MTGADLYAKYLQTPEWRELSEHCKRRDGYKCRLCGSTEMLAAHHVQYPTDWYDTKLDQLITLCDGCHKVAHQVDELCDKFHTLHYAKNGHIYTTENTKLYAELERLMVVECWRRNIYDTRAVASFVRTIVPAAPKYGAALWPPVENVMNMMAMVKDCFIANSEPTFNVERRKAKRLSHTRYK